MPGLGKGVVVTSLSVAALMLSASATFVTPANAQSRTTSVVRGTVVGPEGLPVEGADITIRQLETGAQQATATNAVGRYLFPLLQPGGPYELRASFLGYAGEQRDSIYLAVGDIITIDIEMRQEAIQVEGIDVVVDRAEVFNPSQVGPATRITERTVEAMPLLSRNVMELAVLSPLVKVTESGGFSVAGQNDRYNAIMVDGILNKDVFGLTSGGVPGGQAGAKLIPVDAVAQYEVLVAPFDVRLSGFTGGVMNAVTRTGTNEWRFKASAVHRAEALMGDLDLPTGPVEASGVDRSLLALSLGGPIKRDRGHFYVTGEFEERNQPPPGYNLGRDDPMVVRISPDAIGEMQSLFSDRWDLDTGDPGTYPLAQQLSNMFGRLDWNFENGSRITVRNIFSRTNNDESPNRLGAYPYELSSNAVFRKSLNNTTSLQLFSQVGDWGANELDVNLQYTSDETTPVSDWPQVEVELLSGIGDASFRRPVRVGGQFFAQENKLDQTSLRLTNSLNIETKREGRVVLGATASFFDISHTYLPGAAGEYYFAGPVDLEANAPQRYQRTVLADGESPGVDFRVLEWGFFAQNQIDAGKGLTMRFGIRADVPYVLDSPETNYRILNELGHDTGKVPSGNFLISPRWGFNWQSEGERTTQVRGGAGMFAGQIPYVWLSNAFHNNGLRSVTQLCNGRLTDDPPSRGPGGTVPTFDPYNPPTACVYGDFRERRNVVVFKDGFRYPQDLKFSVAVDRELTERTSFSLGFLFNKALNQVGLEELNIERGGSTHDLGFDSGLGDPDRRYYRRLTVDHAGRELVLPDYDQVLLVTNEGEDWGASISAEVRGAVTDRLN
ncbi:MAG: carboxypeptidase regulatory-like domain-containing protein, partial [Gemmatimonadota bacterium]